MWYILEGHTPKKIHDIMTWASMYGTQDRIVKQEILPTGERISTVFLGIDHGFLNDKPLLFETMIFGGEHDGYQARYATWEDAEEGHKKAVELIFQI